MSAADDAPEARRDTTVATARWGAAAAELDRPTVALVLLRRAADGFKDLADADRGNVRAKQDRAAGLWRLADAFAAIGQADERLRAEAEAEQFRKDVAAATPGSPAARRDWFVAVRRVGDANAELGHFPVARERYDTAGKMLTSAERADPFFAPEVRILAQRAEVIRAIDAGARNPAALRTGFTPDARRQALRVLLDRAIPRGVVAETERVARELADAAAGNADDLYRVAFAYNRCAAAARTETGRASFARDAAAHLRAAFDAGLRDRTRLDAEVWAPYRDRPELRPVYARP